MSWETQLSWNEIYLWSTVKCIFGIPRESHSESLALKVKYCIELIVHGNNLLGDVWSRRYWDCYFKTGKCFEPYWLSVHFQKGLAKLREQSYWVSFRKDVENVCRRWIPLLQITLPQKHRETPWNNISQSHFINRLHCLMFLGFCLKQILGAADYFTKRPEACLLGH